MDNKLPREDHIKVENNQWKFVRDINKFRKIIMNVKQNLVKTLVDSKEINIDPIEAIAETLIAKSKNPSLGRILKCPFRNKDIIPCFFVSICFKPIESGGDPLQHALPRHKRAPFSASDLNPGHED